jgi:CBS domain containing-hemolysin-like protein
MEWIADPNAWIGLSTLIVLEIVLGIDNLVFIAILAEKLPPEQRNRARLIGLSLALIMRLILLASISWIVTLTTPLFSVAGFSFSGRDLILLFGGVFLLAKGTMELHERLEGHEFTSGRARHDAVFWQVIAQIVVLDAVFSLDSVITAIGMVEHLSVMVIAVVVAMAIMMLASKPLMSFVNRHPTVVILCLGFLLLIGFSLIIEGFGVHLPKGYLYAAIGFSVLIEAANQFRLRNRDKIASAMNLRDRTASAVLKLLGSRATPDQPETSGDLVTGEVGSPIFAAEEKDMIEGVLRLADRPLRSIMSPRNEVQWLDIDDPDDVQRAEILKLTHSTIILCRGDLDDFIGVAMTADLLHALVEDTRIDWQSVMRQPLVLHEGTKVLRVLEQFRRSRVPMAIVLDEFGSVDGVATPADILEAIAGEFPDEDEEAANVERAEDGSLTANGFMDIHRFSTVIGKNLTDGSHRYSTLNGYLLWKIGSIPTVGRKFVADGLEFEVLSLKDRTIDRVRITVQEPRVANDLRGSG